MVKISPHSFIESLQGIDDDELPKIASMVLLRAVRAGLWDTLQEFDGIADYQDRQTLLNMVEQFYRQT